MEARISLITLGVADIARSREFYEALGWTASSASTPEVVFFQGNGLALALYGRAALAEDAEAEDRPSGFSGITLAYNGRSEAEVDEVFAAAVKAGAQRSRSRARRSGAAIRAISPIRTGTSGRWPSIRPSRSTRRAISPCRRDGGRRPQRRRNCGRFGRGP